MSGRRFCASVLFAMLVSSVAARALRAADGYLYVTTTPEGAEVLIGGVSKGKAPVFATVAAGKQTIEARLSGYSAAAKTADVLASEVTRVAITLTKGATAAPATTAGATVAAPAATGTGNITIVGDLQKSQVFLDGLLQEQTTPLTIKDVPAGDHTVVLVNGSHALSTPVKVVGSQTAVVDASFAELKKKIAAEQAARRTSSSRAATLERLAALRGQTAQTAADPTLTVLFKVPADILKMEKSETGFIEKKTTVAASLKYRKVGAAEWTTKELTANGVAEVLTLEKATYEMEIAAAATRTKTGIFGVQTGAEKVGSASATLQRAFAGDRAYTLEISYDGVNKLTHAVTDKIAVK